MKEEGRKEEKEGGKEGKKEGDIRDSTNVCMYGKIRKYIQRERMNSERREEIKNKRKQRKSRKKRKKLMCRGKQRKRKREKIIIKSR